MNPLSALAKMMRFTKKVVTGRTGREGSRCDEESSPYMTSLHRWCLDVSEWDQLLPSQWSLLLSLLPDGDSARIQRFMQENDRRLALGSRLLQRALISEVFDIEFPEVKIKRTSENKPYLSRKDQTLSGKKARTTLRNWNFNVSHHGKYVAIASEPVCLCGVDIVDTLGRRRNTDTSVDDYLRYFEDHFSDEEWEAIRGAPDDAGRLRRFFLNWSLKESYVKAVGQGLGFELRRISFARGNWLDCCISDNHAIFMDGHEGSSRRSCTLAPCAEVACNAHFCGSATGSLGDVESDGRAYDRGRMDRVGIAEVRVDGCLREDWSFRVFSLPDGYAACVARGPPSACSPSGLAAGVITNPTVTRSELMEGLALPQVEFRIMRLCDLIPVEAREDFLSLGSTMTAGAEQDREGGGVGEELR